MLLLVYHRSLNHIIHRKCLGLVFIFGVVISVMFATFYLAVARIPMGLASTLEFFGPLSIAVLMTRKLIHVFCIIFALVGVGLLIPDLNEKLDSVGVIYALIAALGWAGFIVLSQRISALTEGGVGLASGMIVAAIILFPFALLNHSLNLVHPFVLFGQFLVALLSTVIPLTLEFFVLKRMSARAFGIVVSLEPALSAIVGAALLTQMLSFSMILAISLVSISAILISIADGKTAVISE